MTVLFDKLFGSSINGVAKAMDLSWRRNQALSSNIANAETPQYRAVDLDFAGELEQAFGSTESTLRVTNPKHMDLGGGMHAHLIKDFSGMTKQDGNNVDLDIQMGKLAHNVGRYSSAATILRKQLAMLKQAIRSAQ